MWVVIAWQEDARRAVDWDTTRVDLGERPQWEDIKVPKAVVWVRTGTQADVVKAEAHAATLDYPARVFTYPSKEKDPLGRARQDIVN